MRLSTSSFLLPLALSARAATLQSHNQRVLTDPSTSKVRVSGRNNAYYTQADKDDQLFKVERLVVYPDDLALYVLDLSSSLFYTKLAT